MEVQEAFELEEASQLTDDLAPEDEALFLKDSHDPVFDCNSLLRSLLDSQFSVDGDLVEGWSYAGDFLHKRYGLRDCFGSEEHTRSASFPIALGLCKGDIDPSAAFLFDSIMSSTDLPSECDLSPGYDHVDGGFPSRSPRSVLGIRPLENGYLVAINDGIARTWKLFINDPLTLIQIEREKWDLQGDRLVSNLVRKGIPFEVLYPSCQTGTVFYPHPGSVVHPEGKSPTRTDYLAYCLDVADFFKLYPHAHAAALCAGGILWRIAADALPLPAEHEIVRPFHPQVCVERMVDGQRYWKPMLTVKEEEVIVGVYKWAGKSNR